MSQSEYQDNPPGEKKQTSSSDIFSEVLSSGREIEGLFEKKRREEMLANGGKKSGSKKKGKNGLKDPISILKERVEIYNNKKEEKFHLTIDDAEELSFFGLLTFSYHNGYQTLSEPIRVSNSRTAADIVPLLLRTFLPQYDMNESNSSSYIMLSQGGSERELETLEKPLEIALDCSTRGLSTPSFSLKTSVSLLLTSTSPQKHIESKLSALSLQASSLSSLGHTSSDSESPQVGSPRVMCEDYDSLYSFSSTSSIPSNTTGIYSSNGSRSPHSLLKSQARNKQRSKSAQKLSFENSFHKMSEPMLSMSPVHQQLTPELNRRGGSKSKSKVGNFMEGVARSLKSKKKIRPPSIYPEDSSNSLLDPRKSALLSPKKTHNYFSMPTVFHIYYSKAKNMQLYKSVLVSENSTARDVIKQSLERYGMKYMSPESFSLFEVIGRWEEIAVESEPAIERSLVMSSDQCPAAQLQKPTRAFEEFVECYTRELSLDEKPFEVQFFHEPQSGYTRRFELRSYSDNESSTTDDTSKIQDQYVPMTPIFGSTSHNISNRRSRSKSQDTFDFSIDEDTNDDTMVDCGIKQSPGFTHSLVDCSSPDSMDILTPLQSSVPCCSFYPSITSGVLLLNLQLVPIKHEFLVYSLLFEKFVIKNKTSKDDSLHAKNLQNQVEVHIDASDSKPGVVLCAIKREKSSLYSIEPVDCNLSINGDNLDHVSKLSHGDLIKIGTTHLFMFQNHSTSTKTQDNKWLPQQSPDALRDKFSDQKHTQSLPSVQIKTSCIVNSTVIDEIQKPQTVTPEVVYISSRDEICSLPTLAEVEGGDQMVHSQHQSPRRRSSSDVSSNPRRYSNSKSNHQQYKQNLQTSGQRYRGNKKVGAFPVDRRLMFSYNIAEEDTLLELLIDDLNPTHVIFSLAPSYTLSMCMEYNMRCSGPDAASRLACKAIGKIQKKVDKVVEQISSWKPQTSESVLYPSLDNMYDPIHSILFWLANTLEFYNFLLSQETLDLSLMMQKQDGEDNENEDNAMTILENIMQHLFQQAFYPISKILYVVLPRMLEEGEVDRSSCVYFVVDFLKRILELMFELHVHTEMIAQFFANVFFFLNGSMFNAFIDQGPKLGLFEYIIGRQLRGKLDILENWAGREGFRDGPLQFFAVFSSAIDLIATPPEELLSLTWSVLREEFPALLPSQLHYVLAHYLLPENEDGPPVQWTPVTETEASTLTKDSLHESFESHPQFEIPIGGGYLLDLDSSQSCDNHMLHEFVDALRKDLKKKQKSVSIVGIKKSSTTTPATPTVVYSTNTYPPSPTAKRKKKPLLNIKEIVTSDLATTSHQSSTSIQVIQRVSAAGKMRSQSSAELRGRVKSVVEPHIVAPEKLVILFEKSDDSIKEDWCDGGAMDDNIGSNIRTLCLQRGNRGFGFTTEIKRDVITGFSKLFVNRLISDGGVENIIDITPGDQILAVDDLEMSCQEFQQYIKDAEEEITLTVCSSPDHQAFTQ